MPEERPSSGKAPRRGRNSRRTQGPRRCGLPSSLACSLSWPVGRMAGEAEIIPWAFGGHSSGHTGSYRSCRGCPALLISVVEFGSCFVESECVVEQVARKHLRPRALRVGRICDIRHYFLACCLVHAFIPKFCLERIHEDFFAAFLLLPLRRVSARVLRTPYNSTALALLQAFSCVTSTTEREERSPAEGVNAPAQAPSASARRTSHQQLSNIFLSRWRRRGRAPWHAAVTVTHGYRARAPSKARQCNNDQKELKRDRHDRSCPLSEARALIHNHREPAEGGSPVLHPHALRLDRPSSSTSSAVCKRSPCPTTMRRLEEAEHKRAS